MSSKYPLTSGTEIVSALKRTGFTENSQKGSHLKLAKDGRVTIVPMHDEVARGTLRCILEQAGLSVKAFLDLL